MFLIIIGYQTIDNNINNDNNNDNNDDNIFSFENSKIKFL